MASCHLSAINHHRNLIPYLNLHNYLFAVHYSARTYRDDLRHLLLFLRSCRKNKSAVGFFFRFKTFYDYFVK